MAWNVTSVYYKVRCSVVICRLLGMWSNMFGIASLPFGQDLYCSRQALLPFFENIACPGKPWPFSKTY